VSVWRTTSTVALTNPSSLLERVSQPILSPALLFYQPNQFHLPLVSAHVTYALPELDSNDLSPPQLLSVVRPR